MKKVFALMVIAALLVSAGAALAADWTEGRSAAQPYAGVPEVDLNKTMGYIMMYPRAKLPVDRFCNTLQIFLPREDVAAGKGKVMLYASKDGEKAALVESVNFEDRQAVNIRAMTEAEMRDLLWGGGTCIEIHLPISLRFDCSYYVLMEEGCFTAAGGKVVSPSIGNPEAWAPVLQGDFGVAGMYYSQGVPSTAAAPAEGAEGETAAPTKAPEAGEPVVKLVPSEGDRITFDIVLGGDAKTAVIYSENDSVQFLQPEYNQNATVTGTVVTPNIKLGVVFLDSNGQVVDVVNLTR